MSSVEEAELTILNNLNDILKQLIEELKGIRMELWKINTREERNERNRLVKTREKQE